MIKKRLSFILSCIPLLRAERILYELHQENEKDVIHEDCKKKKKKTMWIKLHDQKAFLKNHGKLDMPSKQLSLICLLSSSSSCNIVISQLMLH